MTSDLRAEHSLCTVKLYIIGIAEPFRQNILNNDQTAEIEAAAKAVLQCKMQHPL